jgi:hypothetical protein
MSIRPNTRVTFIQAFHRDDKGHILSHTGREYVSVLWDNGRRSLERVDHLRYIDQENKS